MNKFNYNYAFIFYDVASARCNKLFKICKKYLSHYQYSIFKGAISPSNLLKIRKEINNVIEGDDFVCIIKMKGAYMFEEEIIKKNYQEKPDFII